MESTAVPGRLSVRALIGIIIILLWIAGLVTAAQWQLSPTYDEQNHVARGIAILRTGDYRLSFHHPPLANIMQGLPVAWRTGTWFSTSLPAWTPSSGKSTFLNIWSAARTIIWEGSTHGLEIIRLARLPVLLFTLVLAVVVFLWTRELFGVRGGFLALGLLALEPTLLAHSGLATTDAAAACSIVLALYLLRGYLRRPTRGRLVMAGVAFGLALAAKFSALILVPIIGLVLLIGAVKPALLPAAFAAHWSPLPCWRRVVRALGVCALLGVLASITVWGIYGFKVEPLGAKPGQALRANAGLLQRLPFPAKQYFRGLATVKKEAEGHRAYLLGKTDTTGKGWWYYFPVALATKTPLPELLLILGIVISLAIPKWRGRLALPPGEQLFLLLPVGLYLLAALGLLGISLNLGIRHILPILPLLLILTGGWVTLLPARPARILLPLALALQGVSVLCAYPDFISYFNEAAGGSANGYRILVDSNYDWGQDLGQLARLQREKGLYPLACSYFGTTPPEVYGLHAPQFTKIAGFGIMDEAPALDLATYHGFVAISATELMGGPGYNHAGIDYHVLLKRQPIARAGRTIFIYQLP